MSFITNLNSPTKLALLRKYSCICVYPVCRRIVNRIWELWIFYYKLNKAKNYNGVRSMMLLRTVLFCLGPQWTYEVLLGPFGIKNIAAILRQKLWCLTFPMPFLRFTYHIQSTSHYNHRLDHPGKFKIPVKTNGN